MATKSAYDDVFNVFNNNNKKRVPNNNTTAGLSPRIEEYAEIFGCRLLRGTTSIPVLDLPPADVAGVPTSFRGYGHFDYTEVFGGGGSEEAHDEFAVFEDVFTELCCRNDHSNNSDDAWTPAQSETLSDESEPFACTDSYQNILNADFHHSSNDIKHFKVSYNKVFHTSGDDLAHGVAHVAQLNDVPGYSFLVDEPPPLHKMVVTNNLKHEDFSVGIEEGKPLRKTTCDNKPFVTISDISLKTRPSHLPPPSRPPPVVGPKDRDNSTPSSKIKVSRSFDLGETTLADNSPLFYDVEVDASTSAAVSAAAVQDIMEKAQKKLKSAKHKKDRSKQASGRDLCAVEGLTDNSTKYGKGYGLLQEPSLKNEGNVEWKQDEEFYEVTETNDCRNLISVRDNQRVAVHDFRESQVILQQEEFNRKMRSDDDILEKIIVEAVEGEGFVKMIGVRKNEADDERKCKDDLGLEENGNRLGENVEREAKERAKNEKRLKENLEREEKEKKEREAWEREEKEKREKESRERELEEKIVREAIEKEENEKRLRLALEEKEKKRRVAWEREEKEKREKDACDRELEQNILREAMEKEKKEKRLAIEEEEKKQREAWEIEENEKKAREALEREFEEKKLQAAIEKEENEKRLRLALEENERKIREAQEREEKEEREKEAREREEKEKEKEKRENEAREREEKEKRENEIREREEKERREKENLEREIEEMRLKMAHEENEKKQREAYEREIKEKRDKKARERELEEKVQREAIEREENENRLKIAAEKEENEKKEELSRGTEGEKRLEDDQMWSNIEDVPYNILQNEENTEKVKAGCERKDYTQDLQEVHERKVNKKRSEEAFEQEAIDKMWEEDYGLHENVAFCGDSSKVDKDSAEVKRTNGPFIVEDMTKVEVQVGDLNSFGVARGNLQHKNSEIKVGKTKESLPMHDIKFKFDKKPLIKTGSLAQPNVDYDLGERGAIPKKVQVGKDKKEVKVKVQSQNPERKGKSLDDVHIREERMKREREQENERLRKIEEEREREKEREKDRMAVNMASSERANTDARLAEARERLEKVNAEIKLRAERAAVERATAEARERAFQKAKTGKATVENREHIERGTQSSLRSDSCQGVGSTNGSINAYSSVNGGIEVESAERCKARLERHQRTAQRAAKALEEKNMRDLLVQRELAERNRLAEGLDAEVKRWSSGKEGNLRALLSTLQYILGPDSGWKPIHLTEVVTSPAVKTAYRKATLCVHPDKLQQRGASIHQKYVCEKVFDLLKAAWNKFNSEDR